MEVACTVLPGPIFLLSLARIYALPISCSQREVARVLRIYLLSERYALIGDLCLACYLDVENEI